MYLWWLIWWSIWVNHKIGTSWLIVSNFGFDTHSKRLDSVDRFCPSFELWKFIDGWFCGLDYDSSLYHRTQVGKGRSYDPLFPSQVDPYEKVLKWRRGPHLIFIYLSLSNTIKVVSLVFRSLFLSLRGQVRTAASAFISHHLFRGHVQPLLRPRRPSVSDLRAR